MSEAGELTNKSASEARLADAHASGAIGPNDWKRFEQTLSWIPRDASSLLDAGCARGEWLGLVRDKREIPQLSGVDESDARITEATERYPGIEFRTATLQELAARESSVDIVTCLEVLEHIPDWNPVFETLLRIAKRRVVITVPYKEEIVQTTCVHCGEVTPLYGHLRTYDESSFPQVEGWQLRFGYIKDYAIGATSLLRIYRTLHPRLSWMVACYDSERP